jgi:SAM-dependent methyltransferase
VRLPADPERASWRRGGTREGTSEAPGFYDRQYESGTELRLLTTAGWEALLPDAGGALLDVGAGPGEVLAPLAHRFEEVVTTELSHAAATRLRRRGYICHEIDLAHQALPEPRRFDVVSLLNVLDRAPYPRALLRRAGEHVAEGGRLVVSLVLPLRPAVLGARSLAPVERLPTEHRDFEGGVRAVCRDVLPAAGWVASRLARAPYDSRGPRGVATLDALIVVAERARLTV